MINLKKLLSLLLSVTSFITSTAHARTSSEHDYRGNTPPAKHQSRKNTKPKTLKSSDDQKKRDVAQKRVLLQKIEMAISSVRKTDRELNAAKKGFNQISIKEKGISLKLNHLQKRKRHLSISANEKKKLAKILSKESEKAIKSLRHRATPSQKKRANDLAKKAKVALKDSKNGTKLISLLTKQVEKTKKEFELITNQKRKSHNLVVQMRDKSDKAKKMYASLGNLAKLPSVAKAIPTTPTSPAPAPKPTITKPTPNRHFEKKQLTNLKLNTLRVVLPEPNKNDGNNWTSNHPFHNQLFNGPFNVPGDGDCFFYSIQVPRAEMVALVNKNAGREDIRQILSLEMAQAKALETDDWDAVINNTYPLVSPQAFINHITKKYLNDTEYATGEFAKCCALALNWNLYIWAQNKKTMTLTMTPGSFVEQHNPSHTVHVLLRGEHFQILVPENAPLIDKLRAQEIDLRTTAYIKAVVSNASKDLITNLKKNTILPQNWSPHP